jgi:trigger factor
LEFNVNELSASENEVEVTLKYDEIKTDIEAEVKKQAKTIQLPGFRKGKVPASMIKKRFGDSLEYDASEKVANKHFWDLAKEKLFNPIGQPTMTELDFKPGEDLKFKVKFEVVPQIEVKDYTNQKIEIPDFKVKDSDVEKEIDHIIRSNKSLEEADVVGENNNYLLDTLIYKLKEDGEPENEKGEKIEIDLTSEGVNKEIIEKSKGKKVGDSFNFSVDDERTVKNDKGKEEKVKDHFNYKVQLNGIKKITFPELNEELIKKVTKDKASNEEDLRSQIKTDIEKYYEQQTEEITRGKLISAIVKNNDFPPPSTLVNSTLDSIAKNEEDYFKSQGAKNIKLDDIKARYKVMAENDVKWYLIKYAILKKEDIQVSDEALKELAEKDAEKTGISAEKMFNYYKNSGQNEKLLDQKLFDFLKEKNNIAKVDPEILAKRDKKE